MLKLHCDICDAVIYDRDPRVRLKKYPHEMQNQGCRPANASVDVVICEECLSHYTLLDVVAKFEGNKEDEHGT